MKRLLLVIVLSTLLISSSFEFGMAQTPSNNGVGWKFANGKLYLDLGLQFGYLHGDSTYHINFPGGASELKFPLMTYLLGPQIVWGYKNARNLDKLRVQLKWITNVGRGSGKMKDSDWIDDDSAFLGFPVPNNPGLDIYSESTIKLRANIFDANLIYNFWPIKFFSIGPMLGYRYKHFKYDVSDLNQIGFGPYAPFFTSSVPGKVLKYKVAYSLPYFGLNSDILFGKKFQINMNAGYTPWAFAKDEDNHLLRYKLSKGDTDGFAFLANLKGSWNFLPHWFLILSGEYLKIRTTGTQHQFFYDGSGVSFDVNDRISSKQWLASFMIAYRF